MEYEPSELQADALTGELLAIGGCGGSRTRKPKWDAWNINVVEERVRGKEGNAGHRKWDDGIRQMN